MGFFEEGVVLLSIGVIGIVGNAISIPYFISLLRRQNTFYTLLTCLSVCDLIVVITGMLLYGLDKVSDVYYCHTYFIAAPYVLPTFEIGSTGSIYFTMAVCIERYFVVCRPFWYHERAIPSRRYTIPIICFSVLYNIPRFFEVRTVIINGKYNNETVFNESGCAQTLGQFNEVNDAVESNMTMFEYTVEPTELRQNVIYYGVYHIGCAIIFQFLAPLFLLVIANLMIINQLLKDSHRQSSISNQDGFNRSTNLTRLGPLNRQTTSPSLATNVESVPGPVYFSNQSSRQRRQRTQVDRAKVTLAICGVFIFCHLFKWILNIYELYVHFSTRNLSEEETEDKFSELQSNWFGTVVNISNTLVVLNSSINFYVYVLKVCWTK